MECSVKTTEGEKKKADDKNSSKEQEQQIESTNREKAPTDTVDANPAMPAISLNFSDQNAPVKRQEIIRMGQKT